MEVMIFIGVHFFVAFLCGKWAFGGRTTTKIEQNNTDTGKKWVRQKEDK